MKIFENDLIESGLFDGIWYQEMYPDVVGAKCSPVKHFMNVGYQLNRAPSPKFCPKLYLQKHLDVERANLLPLYHYLKYGKKEGRKIYSVGSAIERNELIGSIDSLSDHQVIHNDHITLRGWCNFSTINFKHIVVLGNGVELFTFIPDEIIRDDNCKNIADAFHHRVKFSINDVVIKLEVIIAKVDGSKVLWKEYTLYNDYWSEERYGVRVFTGNIHINWMDVNSAKVYAKFNQELETLVFIQRGEVILSEIISEDSLILQANQDYPVHCYINRNEQRVFVKSLLETESLRNINEQSAYIFNNNDDVLYKNIFSVSGAIKNVDVFVNGYLTQIHHRAGGVIYIDFSNQPTANQITVEIYDKSNVTSPKLISTKILWKHNNDRNNRNKSQVALIDADTKREPIELKSILIIRKNSAPTDELYINHAIAKLSKEHNLPMRIINLDDFNIDDITSVIQKGSAVIVSRYINNDWIRYLNRYKDGIFKLFYLMDDDVLAAEDTHNLPVSYRNRMGDVAHGEWQTLVNLSDVFIVTSENLLKKYDLNKTVLLSPPLLNSQNAKAKISEPNQTTITISYHATLGHKNDLDILADSLIKVLNKYSFVKLDIVLGGYCPDILKSHHQVKVYPNYQWEEYKEFVKYQKADIGLAPLLNTPYNKSKSIIKLMDIAALGAVGIYSNVRNYHDCITHGENGFLIDNDPLAWEKAMCFLIENKNYLAEVSTASVKNAEKIGCLQQTYEFWRKQLDLPLSE